MDIGELNVVIGANLQPLQNSMNQAVVSMEKASKSMKAYFSRNFNAATKEMTAEMVKMQQVNKAAFEESNRLMATEMGKLVNSMSMKMAQAFSKANKVAIAGVKTMVNSMKAEIAKGMNVTMIQNMPKGTLTPAQFEEKTKLEREKIASKESIAWLKKEEAEKKREEINKQKDLTRLSNEQIKRERIASAENIALAKERTRIIVNEAKKQERAQVRAAREAAKAQKEAAREAIRAAKEQERAEYKVTKAVVDAEKAKQRAFDTRINKLRRWGWDTERIGQRATFALTLPILTAGVAAFKMASDYDEALNKVKVAFGESSNVVENFSKRALYTTGMSSKMALTVAGLFGDMATSMNLTKKEAANLSVELTQLTGDVASFKNLRFDEVKTALQGIFTGETESLKRMGVVMTVEAVQEWADAMGKGIKYSDLAIEDKLKLRAEYVKTFLKNSVGDFTRTFDQTANQMRIFQSTLEELGTSFGHIMMKTLTPLLTKLNAWLQSLLLLDTETKKNIITTMKLAAALGPILTIGGFFIGTILPAWYQGIEKLGKAFKRLYGIIVSHPYIAAAAALAILAFSVYKLTRKVDEGAEMQKEYKEASDQATESLRKQQAEITLSIYRIGLLAKGSEERIRLVKKLAAAYPELNIKVESAIESDYELLRVQRSINEEYGKRIKLQSLSARYNVAQKNATDQQVRYDKAADDIIEIQRVRKDLFNFLQKNQSDLIDFDKNRITKFLTEENFYNTDNAVLDDYATLFEKSLNKYKKERISAGARGGLIIEDFQKSIWGAFNKAENWEDVTSGGSGPVKPTIDLAYKLAVLYKEQTEANRLRNKYIQDAVRLENELADATAKVKEELYNTNRASMGFLEGLEADLQRADETMKKASEKDFIQTYIDKEKIQKKIDHALLIAGEAAKPIRVQLQLELKEIDIKEAIAKKTGQKYDATGARITAYTKAIDTSATYEAAGGGSKMSEITKYSKELKDLRDDQLIEYFDELGQQIKEIKFDAFVDQLAGLGNSGDTIKRQMDLMSAGIRKVQKDFIELGPPTETQASVMQYLQDELKRLGKEYADFEIQDFINKTDASIKSNQDLAEINGQLGIQYDLAGENIEVYTAAIIKLNRAIKDNTGNIAENQSKLAEYKNLLKQEQFKKLFVDFNNASLEIEQQAQAMSLLGISYDKIGAQIDLITNSFAGFFKALGATNLVIGVILSRLKELKKLQFEQNISQGMTGVAMQKQFNKQITGEYFDEMAAKRNVIIEMYNSAVSSIDTSDPDKAMEEHQLLLDKTKEMMKQYGVISAKTQSLIEELARNIGQAFGTAFENIGAQWMETVGLLDEGANKIQQTLAKLVIKAMAMLLSNAISYAIAGASQASFFSGPAAPFTLPTFIAEMVGVVTGAFASVPKFKEGAIVDAPTLGIFGEYPGARSNPEIVAPLDKLKSMIGGDDTTEVYVHGQLAGDTIYITNKRFSRDKALIQ